MACAMVVNVATISDSVLCVGVVGPIVVVVLGTIVVDNNRTGVLFGGSPGGVKDEIGAGA